MIRYKNQGVMCCRIASKEGSKQGGERERWITNRWFGKMIKE